MISQVSSRPNYIEHLQSVINFFFQNCYYFSDLETKWPRAKSRVKGLQLDAFSP